MKVSYSGVGAKQSLKITFPSKSINNPNRIRITGLSTMPGYSNGNKPRATDVMGGGSKELKGDTIAGFSEMMVPPPPEYERIYYIYDESDNVIAELDKQGTIKAECLYADGWRLARFEEGKPRYYYHTDQLNNTIAITGRRTGEPTVTKYYAFGDIREEYGDVKDNRYKFTGKELDGTDLYYFGARYYDKSLGRFISIDPVLNIGDDPQTLNPYIYCKNNPLRFVDPDGAAPISSKEWDAAIKAIQECDQAYWPNHWLHFNEPPFDRKGAEFTEPVPVWIESSRFGQSGNNPLVWIKSLVPWIDANPNTLIGETDEMRIEVKVAESSEKMTINLVEGELNLRKEDFEHGRVATIKYSNYNELRDRTTGPRVRVIVQFKTYKAYKAWKDNIERIREETWSQQEEDEK